MSALAAIHVARKQLGLDDDAARDLYAVVTGKRSLREMTAGEQERVVKELRRRGFKPAEKGARKGLEGKYAPKLQALWIAAWNLGIIENRSDEALIAFVKRQAQVDHVRFLHDPGDAAKAIEGLKAWISRAAGVDWGVGDHLPDWMRAPGAKIALTQWQMLVAGGRMEPRISLFRSLVAQHALPVDQMENGDWTVIMNLLGRQVRDMKKAAR